MPATYAKLSDRHPFEVYLLVWVILSTTPSALGLVRPSPLIVATSGHLVARAWTISMVVGSAIALIGIAWHRPAPGVLSITGLVMEQIGMVTLAAGTIFYTGAALVRTGFSSASILGVIFGIGLASAVQAWKIQRVLKALEAQRKRGLP